MERPEQNHVDASNRKNDMKKRDNRAILVLAIVLVTPISASADAQSFFASLFGRSSSNGESFGESTPLGYAPTETPASFQPPIRRAAPVSETSYCVRSCDGKYFPASAGSSAKAEGCSKLCPASETKVFTGSSIDTAIGQNGKAYTATANAYRYRTELVASCTCNGKTPGGLAAISLADDATLRKGDLIAGVDSLSVAVRDFRKGDSVQLSQITKSIRVVAAR